MILTPVFIGIAALFALVLSVVFWPVTLPLVVGYYFGWGWGVAAGIVTLWLAVSTDRAGRGAA